MGAIDWNQVSSGAAPTQGGAIDWSQVNGSATGGAPEPAAPDQPSRISSFGAGLGHGFGSMMLGAQQLVGQGAKAVGLEKAGNWLVNDANSGLKKIDAEYAPYSAAHPNVAGTGNFVGEAAPLVMTDGLLGSAAPANVAARLATKATPWAAPVAAGVAGGLEGAAINPVREEGNFWSEKGKQLTGGAAGGAILGPVAAGAARMISPSGVAPNVQQLLDAGVTPTPGQMMGGAWNTMEQKLSSMPVVGNLINGARGRALGDFNVAVGNRALAPIGQTVDAGTKAGSDLLEQVNRKIGAVYDAAEAQAVFRANPNFDADITAIRNGLMQAAPSKLEQFDNIVAHQISNKLDSNGVMNGTQWGNSRAEIGKIARERMSGNVSPDDVNLAGALDNLQGAMNTSVAAHSPASVAGDIAKANAAYAQYAQMRKAAGTVGAMNRGNVFTPAQYTSAIRTNLSANQRAMGKGLNTDFAQNAQQVLGNTVPDSGTPGRLGEAGLLGAIATHPSVLLNPSLYAAAVPAMAYTPLGQKLMAAGMQARPGMAPAASVVRRTGPTIGGLLGSTQNPPQPQDEYSPYLFGP